MDNELFFLEHLANYRMPSNAKSEKTSLGGGMDDDQIEDTTEFLEAYRSPCQCRCQPELQGILERIGAIEAREDHFDLRLADLESIRQAEKKAPKNKSIQG